MRQENYSPVTDFFHETKAFINNKKTTGVDERD